MTGSDALAGLAIRAMTMDDADPVAALTGQLGYRRTAEAVRDWIKTLSASVDQAAFVASLDGRILGWVEVSMQRRLQSEPLALIGGLVVAEGMRSLGVGRRLMRRAEQWGWDHDAHKVRVTSRTARTLAHRFYLREGYLETKTSLVFEKPVRS